MMKRRVLYLGLSFAMIALLMFPQASPAAPYYEGKVIKLVVGFSAGGGYDRISRILAKHLPKYIPGKPNIIIENMGGASSIIAANYLYNIAKPDGLTIGTFNRALPHAQAIKLDGIKFDIMKYAWIGSAAVEGTVLAIRTDLPYKTFDELRKAKEQVALGCSGSGTSDFQFPTLLKEFANFNYKMVIYPSSAECMLAVERKEVDGRAGSYSSLKPFIERGIIRAVIRGRVAEPGTENLPVNEDVTQDKMGKTLMAMLAAADKVGRPYVAPPKTPAEQMNILREAFAKAAKDPELQDECKKLMMEVDYTPAEECLKIVGYVITQPDDVVKEFAKHIKF
jgi:tripartite-type tricarboxylate transporter receptor subunit TctC